MTDLDAHLSQSAGKYAKRALEAYVTEQLDDFALFAGLAVEQAVKAKLARENPLLLSTGKNSSISGLVRAAGQVELVPPGTPTIGGSRAIEIYSHLEPELSSVVNRADELVRIRNGQTHLAVNDETQLHRVLVVFFQSVEALLEMDPDEFWEPYRDFVAARRDENSRAIDLHVQQLVVAARVRLEQMPEGHLDLLQSMAGTLASTTVDDISTYLITCFICGSDAVAFGTTREDDWDVD